MRILVVGPIKGGSLPIGRAIYSAFNQIGQDARFLDYSNWENEFRDIVKSKDEDLSCRFIYRCNIRLMKEVLEFKPDVIFGIAQSPLVSDSLLIQLRKAGIVLCFWFVEDYEVIDSWKSYAPYFDYYFTIQKEPFWKELRRIGCKNLHYLPTAFDSNLPSSEGQALPRIDVSFVGAPYPNRVHFFRDLKRRGFEIYGDAWEGYDNPSVVVGHRWVSDIEARSIYGRSLININLHSSAGPDSFGEGDFVNPRTFELAGLGVFQLTDMRTLMPLHFDLKDEMVVLKSWKDMKRAIEYFLRHGSARAALAKKARERVLQGHTYEHRAAEIIDTLSRTQRAGDRWTTS